MLTMNKIGKFGMGIDRNEERYDTHWPKMTTCKKIAGIITV